jgi:hypothetical protein
LRDIKEALLTSQEKDEVGSYCTTKRVHDIVRYAENIDKDVTTS